MSKTRGNVIDPIVILEKYGTDALRFALSTGTSPGNDIKLSPEKLEASRNFANKLWNATRFVVRSLTPGGISREIKKKGLPAGRPLDSITAEPDSFQRQQPDGGLPVRRSPEANP